MSRGECFACVVPSPAPSPCERLARLRPLWAGLTPGLARSCLPCVAQVRPRHSSQAMPRAASGHEAVVGLAVVGIQKPDTCILVAFRPPLAPVAGWLLAGDAAAPNKAKSRAGMPVAPWRAAQAPTRRADGSESHPGLPGRRCLGGSQAPALPGRAGTVLRHGPQAHGSRANRATTATPVTIRARRTSAANHGGLVSCSSQ